MTPDEFRGHAHSLVEWMAMYLENVEKYPVKSGVKPREIFNKIPSSPPAGPEPFENFMHDLEEIIMPGITHWQSPGFFAYFPANSSPPSVLAEMITATLGAQCVNWETSPAAAELEEKMMIWLREMTGLHPLLKVLSRIQHLVQLSQPSSQQGKKLPGLQSITTAPVRQGD